ncbi:class I SAM-dependent methyltransferase [Clostridium gasigenes]|uniref:class I SAM-dependent methyltransferase n=1 Tax=Clostridium gasigenes TaxID=94869 RepID=UPI0014385DE6|nr:class I SAM-dependent methyltransferase [Clostridium gasigenes]NKF06854.1 class I SAM-dependent methyltransferase [Clostridium gasigenes]QSW19877.1 class I SAM-dependent methyltransferase [Clostridium gasigenes]
MDYMGNKDYWDEKFYRRGKDLFSPEKILVESIGCFKAGTVLDVACGDGRNTIFLLENDFKVTAIDFSEKALERLNKFSILHGHSVIVKQVDLSIKDALKDIGVFDNIVINHYRLSKEILNVIYRNINRGGILFINGFGANHKVDDKITKDDLIYENDFDEIKDYFELVNHIESTNGIGVFSTYIFRKNNN